MRAHLRFSGMPRPLKLLSSLLLLSLAPACLSADGEPGDDSDLPADPAAPSAPVDEDLQDREGEVGRVRVTTPDGPMTITYVVENGRAIHEGDVDLGPVSELHKYRGGAANLGARWPGGNVYYRFDDDFTGVVCGEAMTNCESARTRIRTVLAAMEEKLPLNFIEDTSENADNYITFDWAPADSTFGGVSDSIGMDGGEQTVKFRSGHLDDPFNPHWFESYNRQPNAGTIRHEVLHAVGLWHEQSRSDRDLFIDVNESCIIEEKHSQFAIKDGVSNVGPYDFSSIMHYGATSACVAWPDFLGPDPDGDGCICKSMEPLVSGAVIGGGARPAGFSIEDTNTLYRMYAKSHGVSGASDHYGKAIAIGDFDDDGYADLAVGVPDEEIITSFFPTVVTVTNAGAVMLYKGTSNGPVEWTRLTELQYSGDTTTNGRFGTSLAVLDLDADGIDDLAVGAPGTNGNAGAVFTFLGSRAEKPIPHRMLTQELAGYQDESGDRFGEVLAAGAITGQTRTDSCNPSFNGTRYGALVVGAPGDRNAGLFNTSTRGGAAYIFHEFVASCSSPILAATTRVGHGFAHSAATGDDFGAALAVGDLDADGKADVVIGAPGRATDDGAIYTYKGQLPAGSPLFWSSMVDSAAGTSVAGGTDTQFGSALAIGNVYSSAAGVELVVGAPGGTGRVFVMSGGLAPVNNKTLLDDTAESGDRFGAALAIGNVDRADSLLDLVVGIPGENSNAGAIAIIRGGLLTVRTTQRQIDQSPLYDSDAGDQFGAALAIGQLDGRGPIPSTSHAGSLLLDVVIAAPGEAPDAFPFAEGPAGAGAVTLMRGTSSGLPATWKQFSQGLTGKL
jgi:Astacin (Peptidase family M12A)/FG-GAP repeat